MDISKRKFLKPVLMILQLIFVNVCLQIVTASKSDQVLLKDVSALTLHHGQFTKARRSDPVPQLKCVGGTAGCSFRPKTVQCKNKGSDGFDVQWECKTDMDNSYRFGQLEVTCEGFDYPDDPYILRGSCGLEYTLDLTEEGLQRKNQGNQHSGYQGHQHSDDYHDRSNYYQTYSKKTSSVLQDLMYLGIFAVVIYVLYKTCIASSNDRGDAPPSYEETFRNRDQPGTGQQPPPYGFRPEYMPNNGGMGGGSCSSGAYNSQTHTTPGAGTGGGFWSGAFTGGIMGYLLGNRNNGYTGYQRPHSGWWGSRNRGWGTGTGLGNNWGTGWGNNWGSGYSSTSFSSSSPRFSSSPSSSGTRTASGFASTKRR